MDIDKLLESLAVVSEVLKTPSLTNQVAQDPNLGKKVKELDSLVEKIEAQRGDIVVSDDNLYTIFKEIYEKIEDIEIYCNLNLQKMDFLKNLKPLI
jgi:hypothetical protein